MRPGFRTRYEQEVARGLAQAGPEVLVTEQDLAGLPSLLQTYLHRAGAVGRPRVQNFRVRFRGEMRPSHHAGWMRIQAEQHTFLGAQPARLFLMKAARFGVPFEAFHCFKGAHATMEVRVARFFQVVDARGPEMDQGETVTFFNDLCLLAPAALLEAEVTWEDVGGHSLKGTFRHQGHCVSAVLTFDAEGDLRQFTSEDRFQSSDGKVYRTFPWSTPIQGYRDCHGVRLVTQAEAVWLEPEGPFPYARFEVEDLVTNGGAARAERTP